MAGTSFSSCVENWLGETQAQKIAFQDAWNDRELERKKAWDVSGGDFQKMKEYVESLELVSQIDTCMASLQSAGIQTQGTAIDLAAGNLWATPHLLRHGAKHVCAVEYSKHRILELGPLVLEHFHIRPEQVTLALGSFYELRLPDASIDLAFMSQAFHHADDPSRLLGEIRRVLKPRGAVVIIGEHSLNTFAVYAKYYLRELKASLREKRVPRISPDDKELMPPDDLLGDHYYCNFRYRRLFSDSGFKVVASHHFDLTRQQAFALVKN